MKHTFMVVALLWLTVAASVADESALKVAVDLEERPVANLSTGTNIYHGGAERLYAFLVIKGRGTHAEEEYVTAYDVGYRLISPDGSVVNHGFHRLSTWESLDSRVDSLPEDLNLPGARVPAAVGYWELELTKGSKSRAELQIIPNPANGRATVALVDRRGQIIPLPNDELSQDVTCHGLINKSFCRNPRCDIDGLEFAPGQLIASFMPGVIEMAGRRGSIDDISDPGLKLIAEDFQLTGIKRLFRSAEKNPARRLSRTGHLYTPVNKWDDYVLYFAEATDMSSALNALLSLPRCVHAEPNLVGRPLSNGYVPNDSLAADSLSWHLYRINMPAAWEREIGDPSVHIGVVDGGVDYHLADFGGGIGSGKKTAGGYDYANGDDDPKVLWGDDFCGAQQETREPNHGNWMQSVLGALTNNDSVGVAGVAGGWGGYEGELGPSIYHFKVRVDSCGRILTDAMADAIASAYDDYGCAVLSNSIWRLLDRYVKAAICDFHAAGGVFVATTNNIDSTSTPGVGMNYPGYYRNDWVLCVQGSSRHPIDGDDTTPERRVSGEDPLYNWDADWPPAHWPIPLLSIDVCAPASHMYFIYADSLLGKKPFYGAGGSGVSYSSPQVAGVVGLMLAENEHLMVSEIEGLVSASCTDITSDDEDGYEARGSLPGWDKFTGWGRINADSCLMFADRSDTSFGVQCFTVSGGGAIVDSGASLELTWFDGDERDSLNSGWYYAKRFEVRRAVTPPSGYRFMWGRPCERAGWGWTGRSPIYDPYNFQDPYCGLVPSTQYAVTCTLFSYIYDVWDWSQETHFGVLPDSAHLLDWSYGVLREGLTAGVVTETDLGSAGRLRILSVAPNPGRGEVLISFQIPTAKQVSVRFYDVRGREVRALLDEKLEAGTHARRWDGRNSSGIPVAPGIYLCRVATADQYDIRKVLLVRKGGN